MTTIDKILYPFVFFYPLYIFSPLLFFNSLLSLSLSLSLSLTSDVPFLDSPQSNTDKNTSPNFQRDLEALRSCLDMLFQSKVIEARKYIPMVTQALKQLSLVRSLVPELVQRVMQVSRMLV